jgi:hypothetical protein
LIESLKEKKGKKKEEEGVGGQLVTDNCHDLID